MGRCHRRISVLLLAPIFLLGIGTGVAAGATPAATFLSPAPTLIPVSPGPTFTVTWTESVTGVTGRTIAVQASRAMGASGCDIRWLPVSTNVAAAGRYVATGLTTARCYRFVLTLDTASGPKTVTSTPIVITAAYYGSAAVFSNPIRDGLVVYGTTNTISWVEWDTFGFAIVGRSLIEQTAPAVNGACAGVTWTSGAAAAVSSTSSVRSLQRGMCYRYVVTTTDSHGYRASRTSAALMVAPALPAWTGRIDLYRSDAFASQATNTWCVAASTQMMLNMVLGTSDATASAQATYIAYAQANDAGSYPVGSDPAGWAAALRRYGGGAYTVARYSDRTTALTAAVNRMRATNKPVGLLVMAGQHAWVMNGFSATADPGTTNSYSITAIMVTGPLYPRPKNGAGYDPAPDTFLSTTQLAKYFTPYSDPKIPEWNGRYILVLP